MRRKGFWTAVLATLCLLLSMLPGTALADANRPNLDPQALTPVTVTINGKILQADAYMVSGRTMVPLRAIFEALGASIEWNGDTYTVTAKKGNTVVQLTVGELGAVVDGQAVQLAVPPVLIANRTFVPLRFVSQALGAEVNWDQTTRTAIITTGEAACTLSPYQKHSGTIQPGGETWGACGSPHVVSGTYYVQGPDSPVLTITKGAIIQFEGGAELSIGNNQPGGLVVNGSADQPVVFTAATTGAQPGFWDGIRFFDQALQASSQITNARIEYAGRVDYAAISVNGSQRAVAVQLTNVEISNSGWAGINLIGQGQLSSDSSGLSIHDTVQAKGDGGFAIITDSVGSNNLPAGNFRNNFANAVRLDRLTVTDDMTLRNVSVPYVTPDDIIVGSTKSPTLTIEPGVVILFGPGRKLDVGNTAPGQLVADATTAGAISKADLDQGLQLATASSTQAGCAACAGNKAIVFGSLSAAPDKGAWKGVRLMDKAGASTLKGVVIAYGGDAVDNGAGLWVHGLNGSGVNFTLANSMITGAPGAAMQWQGTALPTSDSTGNYFTNSLIPVRLTAENVGSLPSGQTFTDNTRQMITVTLPAQVTKTATWRNHGIPYLFESDVIIAGASGPVVTIEPGTELRFGSNRLLTVGSAQSGSLVAAGTADKPIKFTGDTGRIGGWRGIKLATAAGAGNQIQYAVIEYAATGVQLDVEFGPIIQNCTFQNNTTAIWKAKTGTDFTTGLNNQFQGNTTDQNKK